MKPVFVITKKYVATQKNYFEFITNDWEAIRKFLNKMRTTYKKLQDAGFVFTIYSKKLEGVIEFDDKMWTIDTPKLKEFGC